MTPADLAVLFLLAAAVGWVLRSMKKRRHKAGCQSCAGCTADCPQKRQQTENTKQKKRIL